MIQKTVFLTSIDTGSVGLGFVGENEHIQIVIKCDSVFDAHPSATVSMLVKSPSGTIYEPDTMTLDGNNVVWTITDSDTGSSGGGQFQLTFTDGTEVMKSAIASTTVSPSIIASF